MYIDYIQKGTYCYLETLINLVSLASWSRRSRAEVAGPGTGDHEPLRQRPWLSSFLRTAGRSELVPRWWYRCARVLSYYTVCVHK